MRAVLDFGRGRQKWLNSAMGSMWVGERGGGSLWCAGQVAVITFEEGSERGGGGRFVPDKQAMFAYLPSAYSPPSISILQCLLRLFLAGCEALSR